jgi:type IV secretion system protein VirD4
MATEIRAMKNYAGSRLSPWLGHLMISRQETARPLLTPGEIMQLPPDDEIVMISGSAPVRAKKARYYEDPELARRILPPPAAAPQKGPAAQPPGPAPARQNTWDGAIAAPRGAGDTEDPDNAGIRREPELPEHEEIVAEPRKPVQEFEPIEDEADDDVQRQRVLQRNFGNARQISLDAGDDKQM